MSKTIMTVDDSPTMRMLLRAALGDMGFAVIEAEDGIAALERIDAITPDMLITDLNMPRMDGFGLIAEVRGRGHRSLPILVLTTESSDDKRRRARDAGAIGWIVKPFTPDRLAAAIRRAVH